MAKSIQTFCVFILAACAVVTVTTSAHGEEWSSSRGQQNASGPTVVAVKLNTARLHEILAHVGTNYGVSFLLDGEPDDQTITVDYDGTLDGLLDKLGASYDMRWRRSASGIIVLEPNFSNTKRRPQSHLNELRAIARSITNSIQRIGLDPETNEAILLRAVYQTLPEQVQTLLNQGRQIPLSALPFDARSLAYRAVAAHLFRFTYKVWENLATQLALLDAGEIVISDGAAPNSQLQARATGEILMFRVRDRQGESRGAQLYPHDGTVKRER